MESIIIDNNILVDMEKGELLDILFKLSYEFRTTDFVYAEFKKRNNTNLQKYGLIKLKEKYRRLSVPDLSVLVLAKEQKMPLITGDKDLKKASFHEKVTCYGVLWILDIMVSEKIVAGKRAVDALSLMRNRGRYLPEDECIKRINIWGKLR